MISPATHRIVYVSGPISGQPGGNRRAFASAATRLRHQGYIVVSPHELGIGGGDWGTAMRRCLAELVRCDAVAVLPGWRRSRGATIEAHLARQLGMPVVDSERLQDVRGPLVERK